MKKNNEGLKIGDEVMIYANKHFNNRLEIVNSEMEFKEGEIFYVIKVIATKTVKVTLE